MINFFKRPPVKYSLMIIIFSLSILVLLMGILKPTYVEFAREVKGRSINMELLEDASGNKLNIGNRALIHIYADYCPSCVKDKYLFEEMGLKNNYDVIGLQWIKKSNAGKPKIKQAYDTSKAYSRVAHAKNSDFFVELGMTIVPLTLVVGKNGKILYSHRGKLDKDTIENEIIPIINAK